MPANSVTKQRLNFSYSLRNSVDKQLCHTFMVWHNLTNAVFQSLRFNKLLRSYFSGSVLAEAYVIIPGCKSAGVYGALSAVYRAGLHALAYFVRYHKSLYTLGCSLNIYFMCGRIWLETVCR